MRQRLIMAAKSESQTTEGPFLRCLTFAMRLIFPRIRKDERRMVTQKRTCVACGPIA